MTSERQFDHLIGAIYETALDPGLWTEALLQCSRQLGGIAAHIMTFDKRRRQPVLTMAGSEEAILTPDMEVSYANYYMNIDPRMKMMAVSGLHRWRLCQDYISERFVERDEFYQDFLIPNGGRYSMGAWIDENPVGRTIISVHRSIGHSPFGAAELITARRIAPHLQRALRLQGNTQGLQHKAELGALAIDALSMAMLIVDGNACILHLNSGAEALLNSRLGGLCSHGGRLSADNSIINQKLAALIAQAASHPAVGGAMFLNGAADQARQLFVTPLPAASPFVKDWQTPLALVLAPDAGKSLSSLELLGKLYNLSPAELKLAAALVAGTSPEDYALQAGVTLNTVRTQIKNLYRKTGVGRLPELVVLLSRTPPLADSL